MMVAQGLQRAFLGSTWRPLKDTGNEVDSEPPEELLRLLRVFWDAPSHRNPLSIHNLCRYGRDAGCAHYSVHLMA